MKVSGDITVRAFHRENLDLRANSGTLDDGENFLMSTTGLNVGADLTENVSVFVRLANERDWNNGGQATSDFDLSQAYVTLKELFYAPLTVRIGAQPIVWGRGFVLGSGLLPNTLLNAAGDDRNAAITANEYTDFTAFDAIRATLDLSNVGGVNLPLTADYVFIKIDENTPNASDDNTVQGLNLSTKFDSMNSEVETYFLNQHDQSPTNPESADGGAVLGTQGEDGAINTWGLRGSIQPVEGSYLYGEIAGQWGTRITDLEGIQRSGNKHGAWAFDLGGEYTFKNVSTTPKLGMEWRFYSGNNRDGAASGWQPIAPGYFRTAIREFQTRSTVTGFYPTAQTQVTSGQTNQHELALYGGFKPLEDLMVDSRLSWFVLSVGSKTPSSGGNAKRNSFVGTEWDTQLKYNYTDDVQFGLLYGLFLPGNVFRDGGSINSDAGGADDCTDTTPLGAGTTSADQRTACFGDATAQQLVASVTVKF